MTALMEQRGVGLPALRFDDCGDAVLKVDWMLRSGAPPLPAAGSMQKQWSSFTSEDGFHAHTRPLNKKKEEYYSNFNKQTKK